MLRLSEMPGGRMAAALALVGTSFLSSAMAGDHYRPRGYQYCPPKYYAPQPPMGPDGRPLEPQRADGQPSEESPSDRPQQDMVDQAQQQPQTAPAPTTIASAPTPAAPNMVGDFLFTKTKITATDSSISPSTVAAGIPSPSARRFKLSENDSVLTQDRVFFTYNYFDNAFTVDTQNFIVDPAFRQFDYNSYVVGFEKTLFGGIGSVGVRLPINSSVEFSSTNFDVNSDGGIGNVPITVKGVLAQSSDYSLGIGLGIMTPTGDDVAGTVNDIEYTVENESVHLMPYVGLALTPRGSPWFLHTAVQFDIDANGNDIIYDSPLILGGPGGTNFEEATLLYWDLTVGHWLYRNCCTGSGLAALVEVHYTTSIDDGSPASVSDPVTSLDFGTADNIDIWNLTLAAHLQAWSRDARVGFVIPLNDDAEQPFDFEFIVQINQYF